MNMHHTLSNMNQRKSSYLRKVSTICSVKNHLVYRKIGGSTESKQQLQSYSRHSFNNPFPPASPQNSNNNGLSSIIFLYLINSGGMHRILNHLISMGGVIQQKGGTLKTSRYLVPTIWWSNYPMLPFTVTTHLLWEVIVVKAVIIS